jgi:hypothetical protein
MLWHKNKELVYEKFKKKWLDEHPKEIGEYSWNYLFNGGKQLRPTLFCELWNYISPDSEINYELAFAIECIHVASLVLDDTPRMDNAHTRRGKTTIHKIFSNKKALLIAYDLISLVFDIWEKNKPDNINNDIWMLHLKSKLQRLSVGQMYDLDKKGKLIELASLKTGVLFELVSETVAICIDLDREFWKLWGNYLGILFQWVDDFQDMEEDTIQGNRNALIEAYNDTIHNYKLLWNHIELGIGMSWFDLEIGQFMKKYFIDQLNIEIGNSFLINLSSISNFYPVHLNIQESSSYSTTKYVFNFLNGKQMMQFIWKLIDNYKKPSINLWNMDESEWDTIHIFE